jgi:hypothetical protein
VQAASPSTKTRRTDVMLYPDLRSLHRDSGASVM